MVDGKQLSKTKKFKLIQQAIAQGESKQQVYERFSSEYGDDRTIARLVAQFPDRALKEKYHNLNKILFIMLIVTAVLKVLAVFIMFENPLAIGIGVLIVPALNIILAIEVRKVRASVYKVIGFLAIVAIVKSLQVIFGDTRVADAMLFGSLLENMFLVAIACLSFYLGKKMFPNYGFFTPKKDESGKWLL
jgi:carbon starvation protein CstA